MGKRNRKTSKVLVITPERIKAHLAVRRKDRLFGENSSPIAYDSLKKDVYTIVALPGEEFKGVFNSVVVDLGGKSISLTGHIRVSHVNMEW